MLTNTISGIYVVLCRHCHYPNSAGACVCNGCNERTDSFPLGNEYVYPGD